MALLVSSELELQILASCLPGRVPSPAAEGDVLYELSKSVSLEHWLGFF